MTSPTQSLAVTIAAVLGMTGLAQAAPPDVVQSDSSGNTAMGTGALQVATSGSFDNTGAGYYALGRLGFYGSAGGSRNSAFGASALYYLRTGNDNTAVGHRALFANSAGDAWQNTAVGSAALSANVSGNNNVSMGYNSMLDNVSGSSNTALGVASLQHNDASQNTALGYAALYNATGQSNSALGSNAGLNVTNGSYNIEIGSAGTTTDNGAIRIGTPGSQTTAYIAGISTTHLTGAAVYVSSSGQLGVLASSERYKTDIHAMRDNSAKLAALRPVTFHLKTEPRSALQYGLIAEEVDKVYPELVIRDENGKIQGVRYDELAPILLDEVHRQRRKLQQQQRALQTERAKKRGQEAIATQLVAVLIENEAMHAVLLKLQTPSEQLAMR